MITSRGNEDLFASLKSEQWAREESNSALMSDILCLLLPSSCRLLMRESAVVFNNNWTLIFDSQADKE